MKRVMKIVAVVSVVAGAYLVGRAQGSAPLKSGVTPEAKSVLAQSGDWGTFRSQFAGPTAATADVLSGYVDLKPGQEPHPPHTHVDEEFLYLVEGSGEWYLNGKTIPATKGDVLYTAPNDVHGIKNTSTDKPLRFFVAKWRTK
jgi:quercetin dioxygenase-like cupin family protein